MQLQSMEFVNYKNSPNFKVDFKGSGLYVIKGKNKTGKTSILNGISYALQAIDPTLIPTNITKEKGQNTFTYTNKKGDEVIVTEEHQKNAKTKFKMILNGDIKRTVGDIRNLFNHTPLIAEEFIALSKTKAGKAKQKEIILNLLPLEQKTEFYDLEDKEKELYKERTIINSKVKDLDTALKNNSLTESEIKSLKNYDEVKKGLTILNKKLANIEILEKEFDNLKSSKENFNANINLAISQIKDDFEESVIESFNELIDATNEIFDKKIENFEVPSKEKLETRIEKGETMLEDLDKIKTKQAIYKDKEEESTKYIKKQKQLNDALNLVRLDLTNFFEDKDLPIPELIIKSDDEGLYIKTDKGELPFDDKQMSTSTMMLITLKIMFYVNTTTPVLLLGKLESFDDDSLETIIKFAKNNNCQIIADKVTNDDKFIFELISDKNVAEVLLSIDTNDIIDVEKKSTIKKEKVIKSTKKEIKKENKEKIADISEALNNQNKEKNNDIELKDELSLF